MLGRCLQSIEAQTYQDFEVLIVVDGFDRDVVTYLDFNYPQYLCFINEFPRGAALARNRALRQAKGKYLAFLDDDDQWDPDYLFTQVNLLRKNPEMVLSYSGHFVGNEALGWKIGYDKPLRKNGSVLFNLLSNCFIHSMSLVVCRREVLEAGLLDPAYRIVHDWEWYLRIVSKVGDVVGYVPKPMVYRTFFHNQLVSDLDSWHQEERYVLTAFFRDYPEYQKLEAPVRAFRALIFGVFAFKRKQFRFAFSQFFIAAIKYSFKNTLLFFGLRFLSFINSGTFRNSGY